MRKAYIADGDTMRRLADRCRDRQRKRGEVAELRRSVRESTRLLHSHMLQDLLSGLLRETDSGALWDRYRFRQESGWMRLALFQFDYDEDALPPVALRAAEESALQACIQPLEAVCAVSVACAADGLCVALLGLDGDAEDACAQALRQGLARMAVRRDGVECTIALSPAFRDVSALGECCGIARAMLTERLVGGTGRVYDRLPPPDSRETGEMLEPFSRLLADLPRMQTTRGVEAAVDSLMRQAGDGPDARGETLFALVRRAGGLFLLQPGVTGGPEKAARFASRIAHIGHVSGLFAALKDMMLSETAELRQRDAGSRPIRLAREYVLAHYSEPITLEQVCGQIGFSASYFSSLFRKETGENFLHYLTRIRMERARELLSGTSLPVSQISRQIGYNDPNYFIRIFKKETTLSPGQYRRLYG